MHVLALLFLLDLAAAGSTVWTPEKVRAFVEKMPKAELHLHLDGALSPSTIKKLADRQGYAPLAGKSEDEIAKVTVVDEPRGSLGAVLEAFHAVYPLLLEPAAVEEAAYDLAAAEAKENVRYMEVRFAPVLQVPDGAAFTSEDVLNAALRGLERGKKDFGVDSRVILCLIRPFTFVSKEKNEEMLQLAVRYSTRGVVGIDLAGDESKEPLTSFADWYRRARKAGLKLTAHAGEAPGSRDVDTALRFPVDRLGHADSLASDDVLLKRVVDRRIPIEVNPTSNVRTAAVASYEKHPARRWFQAGVPLAVSSDDPGVFGIGVTHEYRMLVERMGFSPDDLSKLSLQSVDAAFLPAAEKQALRKRFQTELDALLRP